MRKYIKSIISFALLTAIILMSFPVFADDSQVISFSDVPAGHWAEAAIDQLRLLKITDGIGNNKFGLGLTIKRSEFVTYLVRLMNWELIKPEKGSFTDNMDSTAWYYSSIETALKNGVISSSSGKFRPNDPITREEMAVMIVNALGYDTLAMQMSSPGSTFIDVFNNVSYITIARDFGIIQGVGGNKFKPVDNATREQAAAMMMRMYQKLDHPLNDLFAFYAISSSKQEDMIKALNSVGFGWSRLEYDEGSGQVVLNTTAANNNEYAVPAGFSEPFGIARQNNVSTQLMIAVKNDTVVNAEDGTSMPLPEYILSKPDIRSHVIAEITAQVDATVKDGVTISFDGVVIDFEGLKGDTLKEEFNLFLSELKQELDKSVKKLYVAIPPKRTPGQVYFDGYDYRTIGGIADKVILMAHDYYAKNLTDSDMQNGYTITPMTPIDEVYYALEAVTDKDTGVKDVSKIYLQLSFDSVLWKLKDGKVINKYPYSLDYGTIQQRLLTDAAMNYSDLSQDPYITFLDASDGTNNVLWYEDSRSIQAKIDLAKMFGINGISLWRLGNIPDYDDQGAKAIYMNVWQKISNDIKSSKEG